jgi:hypothetical protein
MRSSPSLLALLLVLLPVPLAGCSSGSPSAGAGDAGEASTTDATDDVACFPLCGSGSSSGGSSGGGDAATDGSTTCSQLAALVSSLEPAARACNPQMPSQCGGTTQGLCCALTVNAGNDMAVNEYESAVANYKSQCSPSCMGSICPTVPSQQCDSTGTSTGGCR